ncbi:MAG: aminoglycoside phosphotransferase family protein [Treponema sp.]|jgi:hypothetical protein|nr:aminoglycoside phosphotransferase family protein [Treponema sp.]
MKENNPLARLEEVIHDFAIHGCLEEILPLGKGHINDTFISAWNQSGTVVRYTHQRINDKVFLHPDEVMDNISRITLHIAAKLSSQGVEDRSRVLTLIPGRSGKPWVRDREGGWWRTYYYIEGTHTGDTSSSPIEAELLGRSIGQFQKQLADIAGPRLYEAIPDFHNMETRYLRFHKALEKDEFDRAKDAKPEIAFLLENEDRGGILIRSLRSGQIPERICHNDAKLSNILLDDKSGEAICVIDLDTVMPGSSLFDLGDLIRTVTITAAEDEQDLTKVRFDPVFFRALLKGYLSEAMDFLIPEEHKLLCESGRNLAQIMCLRFCTDFLEGDHYYHCSRPGHNLDRCRTQIALIRSMDEQWQEAERIAGEP